MICLNCEVEYSPTGKYKRFCSSRCRNDYYKQKESGPFTIKGRIIDKKLLDELLELKIIVPYLDTSDHVFYGLKPSARRAFFGLPGPYGFQILHKGVSQPMTNNEPNRAHETSPKGQPTPHGANRVTAAEERV